jgi:hypothetical protein
MVFPTTIPGTHGVCPADCARSGLGTLIHIRVGEIENGLLEKPALA